MALYYHKEKSRSWLAQELSGVQFPAVWSKLGSTKNVRSSADLGQESARESIADEYLPGPEEAGELEAAVNELNAALERESRLKAAKLPVPGDVTAEMARLRGRVIALRERGLRFAASPAPEVPLTGPASARAAPLLRMVRLFHVEANRTRREAAERVGKKELGRYAPQSRCGVNAKELNKGSERRPDFRLWEEFSPRGFHSVSLPFFLSNKRQREAQRAVPCK